METATARMTNQSILASAVAALIAALISASAVHAAEPAALPLKATRFVSVGLAGSDAFSIATDRCVQKIEARSVDALASCKLAVHRARTYSFDPVAITTKRFSARRDYAYALSNYAIAQTIAGDANAANRTMLLAFEYAPEEPTLASNLALLEARRLAATSTAGTVK